MVHRASRPSNSSRPNNPCVVNVPRPRHLSPRGRCHRRRVLGRRSARRPGKGSATYCAPEHSPAARSMRDRIGSRSASSCTTSPSPPPVCDRIAPIRCIDVAHCPQSSQLTSIARAAAANPGDRFASAAESSRCRAASRLARLTPGRARARRLAEPRASPPRCSAAALRSVDRAARQRSEDATTLVLELRPAVPPHAPRPQRSAPTIRFPPPLIDPLPHAPNRSKPYPVARVCGAGTRVAGNWPRPGACCSGVRTQWRSPQRPRRSPLRRPSCRCRRRVHRARAAAPPAARYGGRARGATRWRPPRSANARAPATARRNWSTATGAFPDEAAALPARRVPRTAAVARRVRSIRIDRSRWSRRSTSTVNGSGSRRSSRGVLSARPASRACAPRDGRSRMSNRDRAYRTNLRSAGSAAE